jgi:ribosome-binding factor A
VVVWNDSSRVCRQGRNQLDQLEQNPLLGDARQAEEGHVSRRTRQVGEFIKEEVIDIIRREVKDPRIGFMSITGVEMSPDLRSARIFVSVLGTEQERTETLQALRSGALFIRHHLKPRLHMRQIPELDFRDDRSMERADEITRAISEMRKVAPAPKPVTEAEHP